MGRPVAPDGLRRDRCVRSLLQRDGDYVASPVIDADMNVVDAGRLPVADVSSESCHQRSGSPKTPSQDQYLYWSETAEPNRTSMGRSTFPIPPSTTVVAACG